MIDQTFNLSRDGFVIESTDRVEEEASPYFFPTHRLTICPLRFRMAFLISLPNFLIIITEIEMLKVRESGWKKLNNSVRILFFWICNRIPPQ